MKVERIRPVLFQSGAFGTAVAYNGVFPVAQPWTFETKGGLVVGIFGMATVNTAGFAQSVHHQLLIDGQSVGNEAVGWLATSERSPITPGVVTPRRLTRGQHTAQIRNATNPSSLDNSDGYFVMLLELMG